MRSKTFKALAVALFVVGLVGVAVVWSQVMGAYRAAVEAAIMAI